MEEGDNMSRLEESEVELYQAPSEDCGEKWTEDEGEKSLCEEDDRINCKQKRDIASGKNLNNSFTGPYPDNWDGLFVDKGPNPQFSQL